ncbi:hypothetical protein Deiofobo_0161 [Pseudomonas phage Deifobo]|nr:hypothetical protein Deiofobo_0161 [Pseudomonas phage Deifobo]
MNAISKISPSKCYTVVVTDNNWKSCTWINYNDSPVVEYDISKISSILESCKKKFGNSNVRVMEIYLVPENFL